MSRAHDKAVLEALGEPGRDALVLTASELLRATGMPPEPLHDALRRLMRNGAVKHLGGGRYKALDTHHSKAVKRGQLVSSIPKLALLCGYVSAVYPVVERVNAMLWRVM